MSHPLDGASARIDRAREHLGQLKTIRDGLSRKRREELRREVDPSIVEGDWHFSSGYRNRQIRIPIAFTLGISDFIHNLRCALEYLVFELARHDTPSVVNNNTQFPICDLKIRFDEERKSRLKGVSVPHINMIEVLQPYKGTKWTKTLRDISNPDKHRTLIVTRSQASARVTMSRDPKARKRRGSVRQLSKGASGLDDVSVEADAALKITFPDRTSVLKTLEDLLGEVLATVNRFRPEF